MTEFLKTLLILSASGSILGLLLILLRRTCGKRLPSTLWYYVWLPVLLRLVLPLPGLIPDMQTADKEAAPATVQTEQIERRSYPDNSFEPYTVVEITDEETAQTVVEAPVPALAAGETADGTEERAPAPAPQFRMQLVTILKTPGLWLIVWLAGAVLCFARYIAGYTRFRRVLIGTARRIDGRAARVYAAMRPNRRPRLFCSAYVKTPMLLGLAQPLIILPQGIISEEAAENVLRHELTHYRRGDLFVKWFFVFAASLHWFNPFMPLFRRELDRVCELSCDENVLVGMEPSERRSYGETLLDLASNRTLPTGVVATTFAMEKRALKERLEQIMKFKFNSRAILALTVAAVLILSLFALAAGPARKNVRSAEPQAASGASQDASAETLTVTPANADEFLAAIGPDTTILLKPGIIDLSEASDYGQESKNPYYSWEEVYDGYELVIQSVENFSIIADADGAVIAAEPRYADVLEFSNCKNISLSGFTAGHTIEQGQCAGGVIHLVSTDNVNIDSCDLYGCGILGVSAEYSQHILVSNSDIYECSSGAVALYSCQDVQFDKCIFRDCYNRWEETDSAWIMFEISNCTGVAITDGYVHGNYAREIMSVSYSTVYLLGTLFEDNTINNDYDWYSGSIFNVMGNPVTVAGCEFRDDIPLFPADGSDATVDMDGNALSADDLVSMKQEHIDYTSIVPELSTPELDRTLGADGRWEIHVSTVDEFLAAIASDTIIYLDEGLFDLTEASGYGFSSGPYYYWDEMYDGPGLVIFGVSNMCIVGAGKDATRIEALPRYASVLTFVDCWDTDIRDLTAGHTLGAGMCAGAVLNYTYCSNVTVADCGLFGCGIYGVMADECTGITVSGNEIYECSYGAVELNWCADAVFENNDIHDCAYPTYDFFGSSNITLDGKTVTDTAIDIDGAGPYKSAADF